MSALLSNIINESLVHGNSSAKEIVLREITLYY